MNINSINGVLGSSIDLLKNDSKSERFNVKTDELNQPLGYKDRIDISKLTRNNLSRGNIVPTRSIGLTIDKGTAANTTLYVNRGTFEQIANYTTNNPECKWEEICNEKIKNLMNNDKVMTMLSHIMKNNGGMGISFGL